MTCPEQDSGIVFEETCSPSTSHYISFAAMVIGMFMAILDVQIVASSLNDIQSGLAASPDEVSWIQTSYLIAEVIAIPLSAIWTRILSTRTFFAISSAGFTVSSAMCSVSWSIDSMIAFRCLQGLLGGAMIPIVFSCAFSAFPDRQRNRISVVMGLVAMTAPTLGPSLGGWITYSISWHWLFLINVLPGILVTIVVLGAAHFDKPNYGLLKTFDFVGFFLMACFLGSLQYVAEEGPHHNWVEDNKIRIGLVTCLLAGSSFLIWVARRKEPIVDLREFRDRNFSTGCLFSFIIGLGLYGSVYILPLFLERVRLFTALDTGVVMMIAGTFQLLSAPIAGRLAATFDAPRVMLTCGLLLFACGVYMQSEVTAEWGFSEFFAPLAIRGSALMFLFIPVNALALRNIPKDRVANASGLYNLMRNLGGAVGIAMINTIMIERHALHWANLAETIRSSDPIVARYLDTIDLETSSDLGREATSSAVIRIAEILEREAQVLTIADVQLLMSALFLFSVVLVVLLRTRRNSTVAFH